MPWKRSGKTCRQIPKRSSRLRGMKTSFASANDLADAFRRAEAAHGKYEAKLGHRDANWPEWYAAYMLAEQAGTEGMDRP